MENIITKDIFIYEIIPFIGGFPWDFVSDDDLKYGKCCPLCGKKIHLWDNGILWYIYTTDISNTKFDYFIQQRHFFHTYTLPYLFDYIHIGKNMCENNISFIPISKIKEENMEDMKKYPKYQKVCSYKCYKYHQIYVPCFDDSELEFETLIDKTSNFLICDIE